MKTLNMQLREIKKKFPEQSDRIEVLYNSDEDFRTLCADYFLCMQNLQKFKAEFTEKQTSIEEYQSILKDLEKELLEFIFNIR